MRRKEERSKQGQTNIEIGRGKITGRKERKKKNNKAKQHSTPKAVTFPKENELPRVGLKPMTLYTCTSKISKVTVLMNCLSGSQSLGLARAMLTKVVRRKTASEV